MPRPCCSTSLCLLSFCLVFTTYNSRAAPDQADSRPKFSTVSELLARLDMPEQHRAALGLLESVSSLATLTDSALRYDFDIQDKQLRRQLLVSFGAERPDERESGEFVVLAVTLEGLLVGLDGMTGELLWNKTLSEPLIQATQPDGGSQQILIPALSSSEQQQQLFGFDGRLRAKKLTKTHHSATGGRSLSLALDSGLLLQDTAVQLLAIDPVSGLRPAANSTDPSLLLMLSKRSTELLEPSTWSVKWSGTTTRVSSSEQESTGPRRVLPPVLMATTAPKPALMAVHPLTGHPLWQRQLMGTPLAALCYSQRSERVEATLELERDLVIICRDGCRGLVLSRADRHLMPGVMANSTSSNGAHYPVYVLPVLPAGAVAVINPPVLMVDQIKLAATPHAVLTTQQIRNLDASGLTTKLTIRAELAKLGIKSGRIPTKWGSKAIETASGSELKWALLMARRRVASAALTSVLDGQPHSSATATQQHTAALSVLDGALFKASEPPAVTDFMNNLVSHGAVDRDEGQLVASPLLEKKAEWSNIEWSNMLGLHWLLETGEAAESDIDAVNSDNLQDGSLVASGAKDREESSSLQLSVHRAADPNQLQLAGTKSDQRKLDPANSAATQQLQQDGFIQSEIADDQSDIHFTVDLWRLLFARSLAAAASLHHTWWVLLAVVLVLVAVCRRRPVAARSMAAKRRRRRRAGKYGEEDGVDGAPTEEVRGKVRAEVVDGEEPQHKGLIERREKLLQCAADEKARELESYAAKAKQKEDDLQAEVEAQRQRVREVTGGFDYETWRKLNAEKERQFNEEVQNECEICMEEGGQHAGGCPNAS